MNNSRTRKLLPAAACALLALAPLPARAQTPGAAPRPALIPNGRKYKDTGQRPATGRSGSATLAARALYGKDGQTLVELTTNTFDDTHGGAGSIQKAQLKPFDNEGNFAYARNFTGIAAGYFAAYEAGLAPGRQVQVQASVTGADGNRTDVVTVVESVKVRPDLQAGSLMAPARTSVNAPTVISAVVRELNGTMGAQADCVLYADGQPVDRAAGVWVDAAGTVSVVFSPRFPTPGAKQLEVRLENANPVDYDDANNAASASIEVTGAADTMNYTAAFSDATRFFNVKNIFTSRNAVTGAGFETASEWGSDGWEQRVVLSGFVWRKLAYPMSVNATESVDGVPALSISVSGITPMPPLTQNGRVYHNALAFDAAASVNLNISVEEIPGTAYAKTTIFYTRAAGDVTYHSASYYRVWDVADDGTLTDHYVYNLNSSHNDVYGTRVPVGGEFAMNLTLAPAEGQPLSASPVIPLNTREHESFGSLNCREGSVEGTPFRSCSQVTSREFVKFGHFSFSGAPE